MSDIGVMLGGRGVGGVKMDVPKFDAPHPKKEKKLKGLGNWGHAKNEANMENQEKTKQPESRKSGKQKTMGTGLKK